MQIVTGSLAVENKGIDTISVHKAVIMDSIVILTDEDNDVLDTYVFVSTLIKNEKQVKCIVCGASELLKNSICSLMIENERYDIFESDTESFDDEYLNEISDIEQTKEDAEMFVDEQIIKFGSISERLKDNSDDLKLEAAAYIDYLKEILKSGNTDNKNNILVDDMQSRIDSLEEQLKNAKKELEESDDNVKKLEEVNRELKDNLILKDGDISSYVTINTNAVNNSVKYILYFKEVSYVRYMNTFIKILLKIFTLSRINARLIIQDTKRDTNSLYEPLVLVNDKYYMQNKESLYKSTNEFVAIDKSTMILEDYIKNPCDILILYDRTGTAQDLITGNVTKFWVVASKKDVENASRFRIDLKNTFSYMENQLGGLYIERIPEFEVMNENTRIAQYNKLIFNDKQNGNKIKRVIDGILERAHINISSLVKR